MFGFQAVTELNSLALDHAWKERFRIHQNVSVRRVVMLRARNGANIELFEYQAPNGDKLQPFGDDAGATHIAFYVIDLPGSVAALRAKGVPVLRDPIVMTDGPTAGETWVYFLTPWGSKIELVSYQNGMRYERSSPATRLGRPALLLKYFNPTKKTMIAQSLTIW